VLRTILPGKNLIILQALSANTLFEKDKILNLVPHRFEDGEFPVPEDYDGVLRTIYGNWREIPPPEKRPRHAHIIDPFHPAK